MCAEHPSGDIFVSFRVEVAEPAPADLQFDIVFFQKQVLKIFPAAGNGCGIFDCRP